MIHSSITPLCKRTFLAVLLAVLLAGCGSSLTGDYRSLDDIKESGKLVVLTRNAPTTYHFNAQGNPTGPEYDLVAGFAQSLGVEPQFIIKNSMTEILDGIKKGEADLAAAGITKTEVRGRQFLFGPTYQEVTQQVVCRRRNVQPESLKELIEKKVNLVVAAGTSYEENLERLKSKHPGLNWKATTDMDTEEIFEQVWEKEIDCTVADSTIVKINRRYYPELTVQFDSTQPEPLAWVLPQGADELNDAIADWLEEFSHSGDFDSVMAKYYKYIPKFDYVNIATFKRHFRNRYPKYRKLFDKASEKFGLPHNLLAAQAYQESRWNPRAKSPTGVRGIMMLTLVTAKSLGVKNRMDAKASIMAGAQYLHELKQRFRKEIPEPDRTYMALAAYNVGRGHMHDAQKLARDMGKDPYSWEELREVLPLLSQKKYYKKLKYGYARGREPVRYVQRIRDYANILARELK
ncbi:membrane-bound lytic murein transglycosylase F [Nitrospina gracilis]|nr:MULTISPECIES: membrane-bound lytic murein transglycosylase MltF [Nitrospina]MCF8723323.1 membrane-bound lytic murein transglycosylase F [Nitrospina sp. Nb-3]